MCIIIGLGYKARVGKSVSAHYLAKTYNFIEDAYADSLKKGMGRYVFGLSDSQMEDRKEIIDPFWGISPREILQKAGTDAMRAVFGEDIWIRTLQRRISLHPHSNYAIQDVRFPNEANAIKEMGGYVIKINRDIVGTNSKHISEIAMDNYSDWDYKLDNNSTFNNLHRQLDNVIKEIKWQKTK